MYRNFQDQSTPALQYDESASLGLLQYMDNAQLQELLDDESKLLEYIMDSQQVKDFKVGKASLIESNKSLADFNLSKKPKLEQAKQQLASQYNQAVSKQKDFDIHKQQLEYKSSHMSARTALNILKAEAAKAEEESDETADAFLEGSLEVEDFVSRYLKERTLLNLRKIKCEKMEELVTNKETQQSSGSTAAGDRNAFGGGGGFNSQFGQTPYPTGPYTPYSFQ